MDRANKIERLKDELRATDYIVLKSVEGHDVSGYGDYVAQRQALRERINALEGMSDTEYYEQFPEEVPEGEDAEPS